MVHKSKIMVQVTSREFRTKQAVLLDIADSGEKVIIRRKGNRTYLVMPMREDDMILSPELERSIEEAREEYRRGETVSFKSADEAVKYLEKSGRLRVYDEEYINSKIKAATPIWKGVDADKFVRSVREGDYEG